MTAIESKFNTTFSRWKIRLPPNAERRGRIAQAGWSIWYLFGSDEKGDYLDYYATHRMTNDRHVRIRADGSCEDLPSHSDVRFCSQDPVEDARLAAEYHAENQRVSEMLAAKGFGEMDGLHPSEQFEGRRHPEFPTVLGPLTNGLLTLSSGATIEVGIVRPVFAPWLGAPMAYGFGRKKVLDHLREPCFAETAILRSFRSTGWDARWVCTYGAPRSRPRLLTDWLPNLTLVDQPTALIDNSTVQTHLESISRANDGYAGCWDVVAWRGTEIVFAEAKRQGHDRVRPTQLSWLQLALEHGLPASAFLMVEWTAAS